MELADQIASIDGAVDAARSSIPQTANITVNKDNVLQAAKIIQDVIDNEGGNIQSQFAALAVMPPGQDPISIQAAKQWSAKLLTDPDSFQNRIKQYLDSLQTVVNNLKTSAIQYGYTEEQIAASFGNSGASGG